MTEQKHHNIDKPLEKMTIKELREIAMEIPHDHTEVAVVEMTKDQLVAFIKKAWGIEDKQPHKEKLATTKRDKLAIKAQIRALKREKEEALAAKDKKKTSLLRKRISRLKKLSRKVA